MLVNDLSIVRTNGSLQISVMHVCMWCYGSDDLSNNNFFFSFLVSCPVIDMLLLCVGKLCVSDRGSKWIFKHGMAKSTRPLKQCNESNECFINTSILDSSIQQSNTHTQHMHTCTRELIDARCPFPLWIVLFITVILCRSVISSSRHIRIYPTRASPIMYNYIGHCLFGGCDWVFSLPFTTNNQENLYVSAP